MIDEFNVVIELIRNDFKKINSFYMESHDSIEKIMQIINKHKLSTYAFFYGKNNLPAELTDKLKDNYEQSLQHFDKMQSLIYELKHSAEKESLHFIVIKGIGLNNCIYGSDIIRNFGDLDILVHCKDTKNFNKLLNNIGFFQKSGPTSSASQHNRNARAFMALHAKNSDKTYGYLKFPIKSHQDKPEYLPYYRQDETIIEMHDGAYFISDIDVRKMLDKTVCDTNNDNNFITLNPEYTFILLITNTYENSESFFSNTFDFGAVLRDYVDICNFFKKYKYTLDWGNIEKIIHEFGLDTITGIVLGNLNKVYEKDVTFGCLQSITPLESEWGISIIDRMHNTNIARKSCLSVMRKNWLNKATSSILYVSLVANKIDLVNFNRCNSCNDILYNIEYTKDAFVLSWAIPLTLQEKNDLLLYQFSFFPLIEDIIYTSYKVDFSLYNGMYKAYGRKTDRYNLGAIRKETSLSLPVSSFIYDDKFIIRTILPFDQLNFKHIPHKNDLCVSAEIYKKHYGTIYHKLNKNNSNTHMFLIEIK